MERSTTYLGIDLGGTEIKAVVVGPDGDVLWREQVATEAHQGRDAVLRRLGDVFTRAQQVFPSLAGAGYAIPGVLDLTTGQIELLTNFTPEWTGFGLRDALVAASGLPSFLLNDVRAATVAELRWGAGRHYQDFLCLAIGTGIGGGVVLDGRLHLGSRGAAGELGHQTMVPHGPRCNCGNQGCLEALSSGYALTRRASELIAGGDRALAELCGSDTPTPEQLARAARQGNGTALAIFTEAGEWIGRALANVICVLNPEAVIIGGGVAGAGDVLLEPIRQEIMRRTVVFSDARGGVRVVPSPLGGEAGALGAAAWAMRQVSAQEAT